jgi:hypothetical protein
MLGSGQFHAGTIVQSPVGSQQAPEGWTQVFGTQTPNIVQSAVQFDSSVTAHVPFEKQHEPVGRGQRLGLQVVPTPCQDAGVRQSSWMV